MDENGKVQGKKKRTQGKAKRRASQSHGQCYPFELRRRAVQLCLEEGFPVEQVARDLGVGFSTIGAWVRRYRAQGEAGLQAQGVCTQRQADTVRRLAVEAWLQKEGVISITQNHRVSPIFPEKIAHN